MRSRVPLSAHLAIVVASILVLIGCTSSSGSADPSTEAAVLESTLTYARSVQAHLLPPDSQSALEQPLPRLGDQLASETKGRIEQNERLRQTLEEKGGTTYAAIAITGNVESIEVDDDTELVRATVMVEERRTAVDGGASGSNTPYEVTYAPGTRTLESVHIVVELEVS